MVYSYRLSRLILAPLILFSFSSVCHSQLQGKFRQEYIEGHAKSCYSTQRSAAVNASASNQMLAQYCRCTATYIADLLNEALAKEIYSGNTKFNPRWNEMALNYCSKNYSKF
jgi:hypothetical protein